MHDETLMDQAERIEQLLPRLMRTLFTLEPDHPVSELPVAQLRICSILTSGPKAMSAIGEELRISVSAVTQIADRLERAGLVERLSGTEDRRVKALQLTDYGDKVMRSRRAERVRRVAEALDQLAPELRERLIGDLRALIKAGAVLSPQVRPADLVAVEQ